MRQLLGDDLRRSVHVARLERQVLMHADRRPVGLGSPGLAVDTHRRAQDDGADACRQRGLVHVERRVDVELPEVTSRMVAEVHAVPCGTMDDGRHTAHRHLDRCAVAEVEQAGLDGGG